MRIFQFEMEWRLGQRKANTIKLLRSEDMGIEGTIADLAAVPQLRGAALYRDSESRQC